MKQIPHSWRKLSIEKRLKIPMNYFEISEEEINRIRKISDGRKRLIESAKLQSELFGNIHADLTAWIAGYASDFSVRNYIGSTQKLREMFIKPLLKDNRFKPSWLDLRRNITLPDEMNGDLAEESGIHIGDGNMHISKCPSYKYSISGNLEDEYYYHVGYIAKLMKKLYNCKSYFSLRNTKNCIESVYKSKLILGYKKNVLKFPIGPKKNILIPKQVMGTEEFEKRCLCGIFDTDFNISSSMQINGAMYSLKLMRQISKVLSRHKIKHNYKEIKNCDRIHGFLKISQNSSLEIIDEWKIKNEKHLSKYWIWKETKKYFPFTTTSERLSFLKNKLNLDDLEKITKNRRKSLEIKRNASR